MTQINNYVIYAYECEKTGMFYYIGKGRPRRPYSKEGRTVPIPTSKDRIHILHRDLDEEAAYMYEKKLILFYGREDMNQGWCKLKNRTNGGSGFSGIRQSEEWRKKRSIQMSGKNNKNYAPLNWFHSVCGEVHNVTVCELSRMYPEQDLVINHLRRVSKGGKDFYKGWRLLENQCTPIDYDQPKHDWYNPEFGVFLGLKTYELRDLFPDLKKSKGSKSMLVKVSKGKKQSYKGWMLYNKVESTLEETRPCQDQKH